MKWSHGDPQGYYKNALDGQPSMNAGSDAALGLQPDDEGMQLLPSFPN